MTMVGHEPARAALLDSFSTGRMHHAWLLTGAKGMGKASFARDAARFLLSQGQGAGFAASSFDDSDPVTVSLVEAGAHPDLVILERIANERTGNLGRSINVEQVRKATARLGSTTSISRYRVIIVDSADDLEPPGANALLKSLEEPPADTVFFLVSHNSGRLLPTIRSRCRTLHFRTLEDDVMTSWLQKTVPDLSVDDRKTLMHVAMGSPGRALRFRDANLTQLWRDLEAIAEHGDRDLVIASRLSQKLALKTAQESYEAFLELAPRLAKDLALSADGGDIPALYRAWKTIDVIAGSAIQTSADKAATIFEICTLIARIWAARSLSIPGLAS